MTATAKTTMPAAIPALAPVLMPFEAADVVSTRVGLSDVLVLLLVVPSVPAGAFVTAMRGGAPEVY